MGLEPSDLEPTIYEALVSDEDEPIPIHRDLHGMDLAPANILLANAELELIEAEQREFRLKEALVPLLDNYDFLTSSPSNREARYRGGFQESLLGFPLSTSRLTLLSFPNGAEVVLSRGVTFCLPDSSF